MLIMDLNATIGMITFQAYWTSLEWLPLTNFHPFDKLCIAFYAFFKSTKFGSTSC